MGDRRPHWWSQERAITLAAVVFVVFTSVGCGTRVASETEAVGIGGRPLPSTDGSNSAPAVPSLPAPAAVQTPGPDSDAAGASTRSVPSQLGTAPSPGRAISPTAPRSAPKSNNAVAASGGASSPSAGPSAGKAPGSSSAGTRPPAGPGPAAPPGQKSPVVLASVGTTSGPLGAALAPMLQGAQLWVKWSNSRGGVNGHPVILLLYDDGADPARHRSQVQEAVEQKGAIAFLNNLEPVAGEPSVGYIESKRVPVIGMTGGEGWALRSPMYFPQKSTGKGYYLLLPRLFAKQVVPRGITQWGSLVCVEGQACRDLADSFASESSHLGYKMVYQGQTSLAQPDFTAQCLAAQNAGAKALFLVLDVASMERVASACARQGFKPLFLPYGPQVDNKIKDNPAFDGAVGATLVFPWFQAGTPARDEFHEAMRAFGGNLSPGGGIAEGWVSGKLFERAATGLAEPPSSAQLLAGLWKVKDDTLGGLTANLTFIENKPPPMTVCGASLEIKQKAWTAVDSAVKCFP